MSTASAHDIVEQINRIAVGVQAEVDLIRSNHPIDVTGLQAHASALTDLAEVMNDTLAETAAPSVFDPTGSPAEPADDDIEGLGDLPGPDDTFPPTGTAADAAATAAGFPSPEPEPEKIGIQPGGELIAEPEPVQIDASDSVANDPPAEPAPAADPPPVLDPGGDQLPDPDASGNAQAPADPDAQAPGAEPSPADPGGNAVPDMTTNNTESTRPDTVDQPPEPEQAPVVQ